ncbi:MAG TPA: TetR/AcrR family transcriptional regulator [Euzebya sp.]|nr:TetR/AcrR family transcriptional regulator [Euzebya sp.]
MKRTSVDEVLGATQASLLAVGVRRTTFAEVSRRAGLSRATLYTHFPDVDAAIAAVLTRELGALLSAADATAGAGGRSRDRLLRAIGQVLEELPDHPLFRKVVDVDADLLLPFVVARLGSVQRLALGQLYRRITEGQADGTVRPGDPETLALTVLLAVQGVLLASHAPEVATDRETLHATLLETIDRGLRP